jgi:uncharacterized membrane protein YkoI
MNNDMTMMTRKNKIILIVASALAVPVLLLLSGITNVSTYISNALVINNQRPPSSSSLSTNTSTAAYSSSSSNWTGSIQISNALSQMIQSKVHTTLSDAATSAEKAVGINSHATSANLREQRGYLVYTVQVIDGNNNNSYKVIVDPGNGRVLFTRQAFNDHLEHDVFHHHYHHHHNNNE